MAVREDVVSFSIWRHAKTGNLYFVLGIALCATNGNGEGVESVVYTRITTSPRQLYYRELYEFLDGRFVQVTREEL